LAERVAHAVGLDPAAPAARLLEVPLADARARGGARPGAGAALAVAADRGRERVEDEVEGDARGARRAAPAEVAHAGLGVARDAPLRHGAEALVADAGHGEVAVGHLVLRADAVDGREFRSGEPDREADVHRALVWSDADAREEAGVGQRVVGVEVVGLAPGGVGLDRVREVVPLIQDRHGSASPLSVINGFQVSVLQVSDVYACWLARLRLE